ncbi:BA14K family protein [Oricola sp.]|uniref:BA14K family protein n=1 Tax=Oricola sp. TaxID=1979950 RepID=UPI0025E834C1|nr:BA14K family protein [Oricola sp.]MCI5074337.1 BA14K family protein [Oricola sp.]
MKRISKSRSLTSLLAVGAIAASAMSPITAAPAAADGWHRGAPPCGYYKGKRRCGPQYGRPYHHHNDNDGVAAAIIGLAGVAIIAGALSQANQPPTYEYYEAPNAYPPAPAASGPQVITYESSLQPWTAGWYQWCDARYQTFNPQTGTYHGYDGLDHFCVPK